MSERDEQGAAGAGRRGFLGGVLAGAAGLVAWLRGRPGRRTPPPARPQGPPREPWVPKREVVITPGELGPSDDELAG